MKDAQAILSSLNTLLGRKRLEIFFEDCLMACVFMVCQILLKTTKQDSYYTLETEDIEDIPIHRLTSR
jgi:hypothetical protein